METRVLKKINAAKWDAHLDALLRSPYPQFVNAKSAIPQTQHSVLNFPIVEFANGRPAVGEECHVVFELDKRMKADLRAPEGTRAHRGERLVVRIYRLTHMTDEERSTKNHSMRLTGAFFKSTDERIQFADAFCASKAGVAFSVFGEAFPSPNYKVQAERDQFVVLVANDEKTVKLSAGDQVVEC